MGVDKYKYTQRGRTSLFLMGDNYSILFVAVRLLLLGPLSVLWLRTPEDRGGTHGREKWRRSAESGAGWCVNIGKALERHCFEHGHETPWHLARFVPRQEAKQDPINAIDAPLVFARPHDDLIMDILKIRSQKCVEAVDQLIN